MLKFCRDSGFFLDRGMLDFFTGLEKGEIVRIIEGLKGLGVSEKILTKEIFSKYKNKLGYSRGNCKEIGSNIKVLKNIEGNSGNIEVADFVSHFRARFEILRDILIKKGFENLSSIRRIGIDNGIFCVIGMVFSKRITKNKNLLIEIDDLTGRSIVLVNRENKDLFERACDLLLDDIVAFKVSGSSKMLFASDFVYPDAKLERESFGSDDEFVAFSGDFHIGSKMFLEGNLMRFIDWLNGEVGDDRQRILAKKIKYLILSGDNIDGVGIYPGQEKFLNIKSCKGQYEKLAEILGWIRKDIEIVMCPGQYDAVWVGEPQPAILDKWGGNLNRLENLKLVSNPAMISIKGLKILMYHGASINYFIDEISKIRIKYGHRSPTKVVKEILKRRHLAPTHGLMDYIPCKDGDPMVIDTVPDIIATADQHRAEINSYNNILMIASSCWQSRTPFEEKVGNIPDPCKVPLFNLKTREVKIIDFSRDSEVKWESGEDLVCNLEVAHAGEPSEEDKNENSD